MENFVIKSSTIIPEKQTYDRLTKLKVQQYTLKQDYDDLRAYSGKSKVGNKDIIGIDIKELEANFPDVIGETIGIVGNQKIRKVDYANLVPYLIVSIQFLNRNLLNNEYVSDIKAYVSECRLQDASIRDKMKDEHLKQSELIHAIDTAMKKFQILLTQTDEKLEKQKTQVKSELADVRQNLAKNTSMFENKFKKMCLLQDAVEVLVGPIDECHEVEEIECKGQSSPSTTPTAMPNSGPLIAPIPQPPPTLQNPQPQQSPHTQQGPTSGSLNRSSLPMSRSSLNSSSIPAFRNNTVSGSLIEAIKSDSDRISKLEAEVAQLKELLQQQKQKNAESDNKIVEQSKTTEGKLAELHAFMGSSVIKMSTDLCTKTQEVRNTANNELAKINGEIKRISETQKEINNDLVKLMEKNRLIDSQLADLYKTKYLIMNKNT